MTNWIEEDGLKQLIASLVEKEFRNLSREIPEHLGGNKFRVPPAMKEWMQQNWKEMGASAYDWQYRVNIGYGRYPIMIDFYGRQDSMTMTFSDANGQRMFILELIE